MRRNRTIKIVAAPFFIGADECSGSSSRNPVDDVSISQVATLSLSPLSLSLSLLSLSLSLALSLSLSLSLSLVGGTREPSRVGGLPCAPWW